MELKVLGPLKNLFIKEFLRKVPVSVVVTDGDWKHSEGLEVFFEEGSCMVCCCMLCSIAIVWDSCIQHAEFEHPVEVSQQLEDWTSLFGTIRWPDPSCA